MREIDIGQMQPSRWRINELLNRCVEKKIVTVQGAWAIRMEMR